MSPLTGGLDKITGAVDMYKMNTEPKPKHSYSMFYFSKIFSFSVETVEVSMMKLKILMVEVVRGAMGKRMDLLVA